MVSSGLEQECQACAVGAGHVRVGGEEYLAVEDGGFGDDERVSRLGGWYDAFVNEFAGDGAGVGVL